MRSNLIYYFYKVCIRVRENINILKAKKNSYNQNK